MKQNKIYKLKTLANFITSISFRFEIFHTFLLTILHIQQLLGIKANTIKRKITFPS